jgi:hypothetical protein
MMDTVQKWTAKMVVLVNLVHSVSHHGGIWIMPTLSIPSFDHEGRFDPRNGDEMMMGDMNPSDGAFRRRRGDGQRGTTDPNGGEEAGSCVLNSILHVLTEMAHLGRLGVRANSGSHMRSSVAQADGGNLCGGDHDIQRVGSGYNYIHQREASHEGGTPD